MATRENSKSRWTPFLLGLVWVAAILIGSKYLFLHEFTAGEVVPAPEKLPDPLSAFRVADQERVTLVMAIHPECPCTEASLEQLDRLQTKYPNSFQTLAFFWTENDQVPTSALESNAYWKRVGKMASAKQILDPEGRFAAQFGATVSGSVAAYDASGNLRFQGGLTASRGHAGQSRAMEVLASIADNKLVLATDSMTPSFGCELNEEAEI